jgi:hypothetical protein
VREAEESPLLEAVARERLLKILQARVGVVCIDFYSMEISDIAVITSNSGWCVCKYSINPFSNSYPVYSHIAYINRDSIFTVRCTGEIEELFLDITPCNPLEFN